LGTGNLKIETYEKKAALPPPYSREKKFGERGKKK